MCMTMDGKALSRVCVVNFDTGKAVCDQLVKPRSPITDYLTRLSGITAAALRRMLADHLRRIDAAQADHPPPARPTSQAGTGPTYS
ncbi:hypothetical protein V8E53_000140 [Lactarius tabidus]